MEKPVLVKIEGEADIVKDTRTGALLNVNTSALAAYKKRKQKEARIDQLEEKVDSIADTLQVMMQLLLNTNKESKE